MEKTPKMSGVLRRNCCETCRNFPQKKPTKKFTRKNFFHKTDAFSEGAEQLLMNKRNF